MSAIVQYIIPVFYMAILAFILTRIKWLQNAGFSKKLIVGFFIAKCLAGFAYNWVALHYIPNRGDIWPFFEDGLYLYRSFLQSPSAFFDTWSQGFRYSDLNALSTDSGIARSAFEIIKTFHFLLNFFTFGNLSANTVIFNFLAVLSFFYSWRFFRQQLGTQGIWAGLLFFFLPSMFFYSSGILKEGLVICLLCLLVPLSYKLITARLKFGLALKWLLAMALLAVLKFFVAILFVFCLVLWYLLHRFAAKRWLVLSATIGIAAIIFCFSHYINHALNFPGFLAKRQQEFLALPAASSMPVTVISSNPVSIIKATPRALLNVLFKPFPGEGGKAMYLVFSAETILFWLGIISLVWVRKKQKLSPAVSTLAIVFLVFGLLNLFIIGLIVPNIGAMMRYRSIFFPFISFALILFTGFNPDRGKISGFFQKFFR